MADDYSSYPSEYPPEEPVGEPDGALISGPVEDVEAPLVPDEALPVATLSGEDRPAARTPRPRSVIRVGRGDVLCYALLALVLVVGAWLRFDAQNWDDYTHLHPDERFLTTVVDALDGPLRFTDNPVHLQDEHRARCAARYPLPTGENAFSLEAGRGGYFDADCSPLNPNNVNAGLYVYGEFPLFTVRLAALARTQLSIELHSTVQAFSLESVANPAVTTHWATYTGAQLVGRTVSAVADLLTIAVLFLIGRRLYHRWTGLLAAALYALALFPIQQAHFWTVDAFTTFWATLAIYCAVRVLDGASVRRGAPVLAYLGVWAVGVGWQAVADQKTALGAASLGVIFAVTLLLAGAIRAALHWRGLPGGRTLVAFSGVIASLIYLFAWAVASLSHPDFELKESILGLGLASLMFSVVVWILFVVSAEVRRPPTDRAASSRSTLAIGAVGLSWLALVAAVLLGGLSSWATAFVAVAGVVLLIVDAADLADYALFGVALGATVASRINTAPLAGIIVVAAAIRVLPVLDTALRRHQRSRLIGYAVTGVLTAAVISFIVFRLLNPHAFQGPGLLGLKFSSGWRDDVSEANYLTSGNWDAPPNHQWASRTPYFFPWRNIVEWGFGIPLGLVAWGAWAWAGLAIVRGRPLWTRHAIPFLWVLVCFGWLGGRWVTTMRYFLPIYPMLALLGAWGLAALVVEGRRLAQAHPAGMWRLAFGGAVILLIVVTGSTAAYGFGFHQVERQQLTRVAASRWFYANIPGDFGLWLEGDDGTRQLVNLGLGGEAQPPGVAHLENGASVSFTCLQDDLGNCLRNQFGVEQPFTLPDDATLIRIALFRVGDPARDSDPETVRIRLFSEDPALGHQLIYEDQVTQDFAAASSPYGSQVVVAPEAPVLLSHLADSTQQPLAYSLELTALEGGPVMFSHNITDANGTVIRDLSVDLQLADGSLASIQFNLPAQPIIKGHGDDIPDTPTHWSVGGADPITFTIPADGVIREMVIPHLGDALRDSGAETVHFTLVGPDGTRTGVTISDDFNQDADPLGPPRTVTFDPPLRVTRLDSSGQPQTATLIVGAEDPVYTSGPVIAWEGDWDDPVPWPVCPVPKGMQYRDNLPSGLSSYDCQSMGLYGPYYQGIKLWLVAEDNDEKYDAMTNALDQADYIVITSNRFYDSLSRVPMRWPMTLAYYKALFDGSLGFEIEKIFTSYPRIGPFTLPDEILPTDNLPDWLNEHWEAEEAFHVYDHPAVFVFRKTDAYSPENTRAILNSVSRRPVSSAIPAYTADPDPVGVVTWDAKQASQAPTMLQMPDDKAPIQRDGGTWSKLFDLDSLLNRSQVAAVIVWWLLMLVTGWLTWPLLFAIFPALPDRAFPAAKITGWLLIAWAAWVGGTLNILTWTRAGILILLLALALLSGMILWRRRVEWRLYVRANRGYLLALEGLTLLLFAAFLGVRLGNPDLWHVSFGGEKPMDFAYFNAVLRSTVFPPIDPWSAGGYMNYYYFGYVIVGAPVKLLGIQPSVAYNLILPTLFAMTGVGVFSVAYNWVRARATRPGEIAGATSDAVLAYPAGEDLPAAREPRAPAGSAWLAGLLALVLAVILGNLGILHLITTDTAKIGGWTQQPPLHQVRLQELEGQRLEIYQRFYDEELRHYRDDHGGAEPADPLVMSDIATKAQTRTDEYIKSTAKHPKLWELWDYSLKNLRGQIAAFFKGVPKVLDGTPIPIQGTHRWYWAPTRILSELPALTDDNGNAVYGLPGHNAIAEMPYFTFLYGDLHAHMIAMPLTMLALLWLLAEILGAGYGLRTWWESGLALALGALVVGILRPTNSWDWITYLILGLAGLTFAAWLGAVRTHVEYPPSPAAARVWGWISPRRAGRQWIVPALVIPLAVAARIAFYFLRRMQADEQSKRALRIGEKLIEPTLTPGSVVLWIIAGLVLAGLLYIALVVALRAYLDKRLLLGWIGRLVLFLGLSYVAALPFTRYFATAYNSIEPWKEETTPLWAYLYIHGTFIFIIVSFLLWQTGRWLRRVRVRQLQGMAVLVIIVGLGLLVVLLISLYKGARDLPVLQLVGPLAAWAALLFFLPRQSPLLRAVYALIVLALAISLGVDLVVLQGDIGRQNTVFKFYIQVWFLLSVAGGVALAWLLRASLRWNLLLRTVWQTALAVLFTIALLYPVLATQARFLDRFNKAETPLTLDGLEYMKHAVHGEKYVYFSLEGDYEIIRWLEEHVQGTPVVMEAHFYPSEYHWGSRISWNTGFPTVLGWRFHQLQQHTLPSMDLLVQTRENNVAAFYTLGGPEGIDAAWNLIRAYRVEYIVVGTLERVMYDDIVYDLATGTTTIKNATGLNKFDQMVELGLLEEVYSAPRCLDTVTALVDCLPERTYRDKIYHVVPGATYRGQPAQEG